MTTQSRKEREAVDMAMLAPWAHGLILVEEVRRLRTELLKAQREVARLRRGLPKGY